jgi:hypothetical protein
LPFWKRGTPTPPKSGAPSYIRIHPPTGHPLSHRAPLTHVTELDGPLAARDRCLAARDRAHDPAMRVYWTQCANRLGAERGLQLSLYKLGV